ncbi:MAG: VCBS repeat-containing protein, partial [Methanothrix sp.]|nr:VCBS repeat-containing protein [Methanothrix sp.]
MPSRLRLNPALALAGSCLWILGSATSGRPAASSSKPRPAAPLSRATSAARFREVASSAGLKFVVDNDASPFKRYVETMAGGIAAFDYNGDGRTDIFFANGAEIPSFRKTSAKFRNRLFRNEGGMKFKDVTDEAGLAGEGFSVAASAGDYDNDGRADLFVAGVNRSVLYRNTGNGRFEDVTEASGMKSGAWAVAAGWIDYDNDGFLDLFVVNYVQWSPADDIVCGDSQSGLRAYCHPRYFGKLANALYRNRGNGAFEDVSEKSGVAAYKGRGMAVAFADYDNDGWTDVLVTNDYAPNFLFRNRGDGTFEERGMEAGVAMREHGDYISNMGADFRDYDNDGLPDLSIVALTGQTF